MEEEQKLRLLGELLYSARQVDPWVHNAYVSLKTEFNDILYDATLASVASSTDLETLLYDPFSQADIGEINGELNLGKVINSPGIDFCIPSKSISQHICVAGFSGSGKSNFSFLLAEEAVRSGLESIRITDPKAKESLGFGASHPEFLVLNWKDLRFNFLSPPPNVPSIEWHQTIVGHMSQCFNFWQGAESLLLSHIRKSNPGIVLTDLLASIAESKSRFGPKDNMIKSTVVSRLELIDYLFGQTVSTNSGMLEYLSGKRVILLTNGLMAESETWLNEFLLLWEFNYRIYNPNARKLSLFIYDECQHRLFNRAKEEAANKQSSAVISQLVDESRSLGIGICSLSQEPSSLIKAVLNNSWMKVAYHLGSGEEIETMKSAMGLSEDEAKMLHYMETGEAIIRMAGGYMEPVPVRFREFVPAPVSSGYLGFLEEQKQILFSEFVVKEAVVSVPILPTPVIELPKQESDPFKRQKPAIKKDNAAQALLSIWLNLPQPFLTQGELFKRAEISSGSKQAQLKKQAIREELIIEHKIQIKKTYTSVWEPTTLAYKKVGLKKPKHKSKGGYLHQFIAHRISEWAKSHGYSVEIEARLSSGKFADLSLRKNGELTVVEIAVSPPFSKEVSNYVKDFKMPNKPTRLWAVATSSRARKQLEGLIQSESSLESCKDKITVKLASEFLDS